MFLNESSYDSIPWLAGINIGEGHNINFKIVNTDKLFELLDINEDDIPFVDEFGDDEFGNEVNENNPLFYDPFFDEFGFENITIKIERLSLIYIPTTAMHNISIVDVISK